MIITVGCSYEVDSGRGERSGGLTIKAALLTVLLWPQVSKRPKKVTYTGPGRGKAGGSTFLKLLGRYF